MRLNGFHETEASEWSVRRHEECNSYHLTSERRHSILKRSGKKMASCEPRNPRIVLQGRDCI